MSGASKILESLHSTLVDVARTDIPVLILGESGTGKEVYARLLHRLSGYSELPLRKLSCAILDPFQLPREFPKPIPPDPHPQSPQMLFLDGIDELDLACQRVLLSLLPDYLGEAKTRGSLLRMVSSSTRDLEQDIEAGWFRKELFFRINGVCLRLPPLRERKEDIPPLVEFFLERHCRLLKKATPTLDNGVTELFLSYNWPGNIRELENVVKKIVALGDAKTTIADLQATLQRAPKAPGNDRALSLKSAAQAALRRTERELILKALERTHWNRKRAAQELQISYKSLLSKIKQAGLEKHGSEGF